MERPEELTASPAAIGRTKTIRVALAIREEALRREVLDFLGRCPGVDIVGSLTTPEAFVRLSEEVHPPVIVACPHTVTQAPDRAAAPTSTLLVVTGDMTVRVLRDAIRVGAQGVFEWPTDRADLVATVEAFGSVVAAPTTDRGMVVAIAGARGGAGATFVASHLAATFVARGRPTVLVDADPRHADLTVAMGIPPEEDVRSVQDLVPVIGELSPEHVEDALYRHARGFAVLLGPREAGSDVGVGLYRGVIALLSFDYDPVVLHVSRAEESSTRAVTDLADAIVLVTTLDLLSLYGAKRTITALGLDERPDRCVVVVNRSGRSSIGPKDVHRVLGMAPVVRIRSDRRIRRLQDRGRLLPPRSGGAGRDIGRLATHLLRMQTAATRQEES
jgi:pilus assembly protein CpaE